MKFFVSYISLSLIFTNLRFQFDLVLKKHFYKIIDIACSYMFVKITLSAFKAISDDNFVLQKKFNKFIKL